MYKILFADDDYLIAETVRTYFTANGFEYDFINEANGVTFYFSGKK